MTMSAERKGYWTLTPDSLCQFINAKRKARQLHPVENGVIITRMIIKWQSLHGGKLDFKAPDMLLSEQNIARIEQLIAEQFDLSLKPNELQKACVFHPDRSAEKKLAEIQQKAEAIQEQVEEAAAARGFGARLRRLFGV
jgi:hypothetical protein